MCPIAHVPHTPLLMYPIPLYPIAHVPHTPVPHSPCVPVPYWAMGHMRNGGNGVQGVWATWAMGYGPHGQWGTGDNGVQEVCGTWAMEAMGYRLYGVQGAWGRWAMGYMQWVTGVWGTWGYRTHGQCGTWVMGTGTMGYRGYGVHGQWGIWVMGTHGWWGTLAIMLDLDVKIWGCLTFSSFLKLILNRFWCKTTHFEAYDLLYKNMKSFYHQEAYKTPKYGKNVSENRRRRQFLDKFLPYLVALWAP